MSHAMCGEPLALDSSVCLLYSSVSHDLPEGGNMNEKNRLHEESVQAAERIVARQDIVVSDHEFHLMRLAWLAGYGAGMAYVKSATDAAFAELDRRIG